MNFSLTAENFILLLPFIIFMIGVACIFLRKLALWCVIGQVLSIKAVIAGGFIASAMHDAGHQDLVFISLILLGLVPQVCLVGMVVIHRCTRFGGSLDMSKQGELRN